MSERCAENQLEKDCYQGDGAEIAQGNASLLFQPWSGFNPTSGSKDSQTDCRAEEELRKSRMGRRDPQRQQQFHGQAAEQSLGDDTRKRNDAKFTYPTSFFFPQQVDR